MEADGRRGFAEPEAFRDRRLALSGEATVRSACSSTCVTPSRSAGFEPVCVVPDHGCVADEIRDLSPRVYEVRDLRTVPRTLNPVRLATFLYRHVAASGEIRRIAAELDAVAIHTVSEAVFAGSLAGRRLRIPTRVHVIGMSIASPPWAAHVYIRLLNKLSDRFVACSSAVAGMLARHGVQNEAITVVHNGIEVADVDATSPVELDPGPKIGIVAALDQRKGHELFVEAAAVTHSRFPDARFFVIGGVLDGQPESGVFAATIERRIAESGLERSFQLVGYVPRPGVYGWIKAMDVIVVPSREGFAHALIEAMAAGVPVVATAVGGNLDAFVHGESGLYAGESPEEVAAAVCELLADPERAARIGSAAAEHARSRFSHEATIPALAEAFRGLVVRSPPRLVTDTEPIGLDAY